MSKHEPGTGPLKFLVQSEPKMTACTDCRHRMDVGAGYAKCSALGGEYCDWVRAGMLRKGIWQCPAFERRIVRTPLAHKPGWLRRLVMRIAEWVW